MCQGPAISLEWPSWKAWPNELGDAEASLLMVAGRMLPRTPIEVDGLGSLSLAHKPSSLPWYYVAAPTEHDVCVCCSYVFVMRNVAGVVQVATHELRSQAATHDRAQILGLEAEGIVPSPQKQADRRVRQQGTIHLPKKRQLFHA